MQWNSIPKCTRVLKVWVLWKYTYALGLLEDLEGWRLYNLRLWYYWSGDSWYCVTHHIGNPRDVGEGD